MFSRVLPKSLPQSVLAPWRAVLTAGLPPIAVPARPCEEASDAANRQVFLDAVAHGSVIPCRTSTFTAAFAASATGTGTLRSAFGLDRLSVLVSAVFDCDDDSRFLRVPIFADRDLARESWEIFRVLNGGPDFLRVW
jgi:hypothetical protein